MLTARADGGSDNNFERLYVVAGINDETLSHAKSIFQDYHAKGVIVNKSFEDNTWVITNQLKKMRMHFYPNELLFKDCAKKWLGCTYRCFVDGIKAYALFHMGSIELSGIKEIVRKLVLPAEKSYEDLPIEKHLIDFLKLLPGGGETKDQVIEDMEERLLFRRHNHAKGQQRILSDFENYFRFNDAMEDYWRLSDDKEKLFYFPVYFWWTLTAILPLRPTEFLITPRECIERKNGDNILTIRRSILKGGHRKICYNINEDYRLMKYGIPDKMAAEIEWYRESTVGMTTSRLETLFVHRPHYSYFSRSAPSYSTYYTYQNLSYCLRRFQDDIMKIESDENRINLGDTRHLAMIGLIASGGSPVICKELAGHEDVNISAHYYSNISRFIECATYEMYKKQKANYVDIFNHKPKLCAGETVEVSGGRCDSPAYIAGSISDCIRNMGASGELGLCISCPHFIDGKSGHYLLFWGASERKTQVDEDSKYLMRVLDLVRKGKGCNEDIQSALLKLQHSSSRYSQCLYTNMGGF
jgi:hypothetical protein